MKKLVLALAALSVAAPTMAQVQLKGYTRKDGTYVAPHYRSSPNSSIYDNYSAKGNVNPYTGKAGTVDPYKAPSSTYTPYKAPCYFNCKPN